MQSREEIVKVAREWLRYARSNLARAKQPKPREAIWDAVELSHYAVETRYPTAEEPVDEKEYRRAVAIAERTVKWAEKVVSREKE